jgi:tetratricopeptide (TPR) repeat protein
MVRGGAREQGRAGTPRIDGQTLRRLAALALLAVILLVATACSNDMSQAKKAEQAGDLTSAISLYQERLKASPHDLEAIKALAAIFYLQQRWDEALPMQEKAIALDPKEAQIRVELGFNYLNH